MIRVLRIIEHEFADEASYLLWVNGNHYVPLNGSRSTGIMIFRSAILTPSLVERTDIVEDDVNGD